MKNPSGFLLHLQHEGAVNPPLPPALESPPDWVLRSLLRNSGERLLKLRKETQGSFKYWNDEGYSEAWGPHMALDTSGTGSFLSRKQRRDQKKAARKEAAAGNIGESDYQFWRGNPAPINKLTHCRWCDRTFYNAIDRRTHFKSETRCSFLIRAVQAWAAQQNDMFCMACCKSTKKLRWGFPLCNTVNCIGTWKFATVISLEGWTMYKRLARAAGALKGYEEHSA